MERILVVDDDRDTRDALDVILRREGYTVLTAASGDEALVQLQQHFATAQQLGAQHGLSVETVEQPPQY